MKLRFEREVLLPAVQAVCGVVERRQNLPILNNLLVTTDANAIIFTGTDMEVELVVRVLHEAIETGATTVPARKLLDICRALPPGATIEMAVKEEKISLRSGRSRFVLATLPSAEFPSIGCFDPALELGLAGDVVAEVIAMTQFAMAHQDVRYYLNGLLFEFSPTGLRAVATDGHRLAMSMQKMDLATESVRTIIVPRKGVTEIARLLSNAPPEVKLSVGSNHLKVETPQQSLTTKLVEGQFPDFERVIPKNCPGRLRVDRETARAGLARTSILSSEKFRGVRLSVENNLLRAVAHTPEQEEAEEEIEVQYDGEPLEIGFNVSYLLDVLGVLKSTEVEFGFVDAASSCLIHAPDQQDTAYVIMPMRL